MVPRCFLFALLLSFNSFSLLCASKILAILPIGNEIHYDIYMKLLLELKNRNHEIIFLNPFAESRKCIRMTSNIEHIDISEESTKFAGSLLSIDQVRPMSKGLLNDFRRICNNAFEFYNFLQNVTQLRRTKEKIDEIMESKGEEFDLILIELFFNDGDYIFGHKSNAPVIAFSTFPLVPWSYFRLSNSYSSFFTQLFSFQSYPMSFRERLINTLEVTTYKLAYDYKFLPYAGLHNISKMSSLDYMMKNTALILSNTHYSLYGVKSNFPNIVEIGGIHIRQWNKQLPEDLQSFIDGARHGVIYFCMGSMLKASTIPDDKRDALIKVFSRLPQRVLWKWENDTLPGKSDNVKIVKWMPQRDILAHQNVKLFISHGGLLGTTEAVHCGVPMIGIPFYGDQAGNIEAVASHGAGLRLDYNDINEENLYNKITEILNNPKYAENAKQLSERFRDRPQTPLETAVYWTEYVIRHKGAPHLRSAAVELTWYQYLLLDVIAFILLVSVSAILLFYYTLKFIIKRLSKRGGQSNKNNKKVKKS